ncbi:MAG TPA: glucose 1-dehydrogenase [Mycobacteriales bacterium]|nr:glucose 1-dehydrogenase [Mycobacteriales bacterium]
MRALSVIPGHPESAATGEWPDPPDSDGAVLVEGLFMGVCGTDVEITQEGYGWAPDGEQRLILGHESLGRVLSAPGGSGFTAGDLVAGVVRRPDPVPCPWCANLEWDMCSNGQYTERGIKQRHGYGSSRWRVEPEFLVPVPGALGDTGILLEPTAVVAKAWEQVEAIGHRATYAPHRVLVTGAGPVGLLAALLGVQRGLEVHVLDRVAGGIKADLVTAVGATYHHDGVDALGFAPDVVIEGTGVGALIAQVVGVLAPNGIAVLIGISGNTAADQITMSALNKRMVLGNQTIVGSVNEAYRHYQQAADALARADLSWLSRLVTKTVTMDDWTSALTKDPDDVKVVIDLQR